MKNGNGALKVPGNILASVSEERRWNIGSRINFDSKGKPKLPEYPYALGFLYEEDLALIGSDEGKLLSRHLFKGDYLECQKNNFLISFHFL